jgi:peroxin-14
MSSDLMASAIKFLSDPQVQEAPLEKRISFLESKGLSQSEIQKALAIVNSSGGTMNQSGGGTVLHYEPQWGWKDTTLSLIALVGGSYGLYHLFSTYVAPYLIGSTTEMEESLDNISKSIESNEKANTELLKIVQDLNEKITESALKIETQSLAFEEANKEKEELIEGLVEEIEGIKNILPKMMEKQKENQASLIKDLHNEVISLKNLLNSNVSNSMGQGGLVMAASSNNPLIPAWQLENNNIKVSDTAKQIEEM